MAAPEGPLCCGGGLMTGGSADGGAAADVKNEPSAPSATHALDRRVCRHKRCNTPVWRRSSISTVPRSRTNPLVRPEVTAPLAPFDRLRASGGARRPARQALHRAARDLNAFWRNESFQRRRPRWERTSARDRAAARTGRGRRCALCAEAVWWRCHRRIVADYCYLWRRRAPSHGARDTPSQPARRSPGARSPRTSLCILRCRSERPRDVSVATGPQAAVASGDCYLRRVSAAADAGAPGRIMDSGSPYSCEGASSW